MHWIPSSPKKQKEKGYPSQIRPTHNKLKFLSSLTLPRVPIIPSQQNFSQRPATQTHLTPLIKWVFSLTLIITHTTLTNHSRSPFTHTDYTLKTLTPSLSHSLLYLSPKNTPSTQNPQNPFFAVKPHSIIFFT